MWASAAICGVAVFPVPMAHTGSQAIASFAAFLAEMPLKARVHWRRSTSSVRPASRSSSTSPTQTMGVRPFSSAISSLRLTVSSVSLKYCRRSECPMITCVTWIAVSIAGEISPVKAPSFAQCIFCAPTATFDPRAASTAACRSRNGGQITISSREWPATMGRNSAKNAVVCSGVLYIFQLAAMSFLRVMVSVHFQRQVGGQGASGMGVLGEGFRVKQHEPNFADVSGFLERLSRAGYGDLRRLVHRIPVGPCRNRRDGDGCELKLIGDANRLAMATGQRFRLTLLAAAPERADGMDDVARRQASGGCCDCLSGGKAANAIHNLPAGLQDRRPSCAMDGPVHTTSAEQGRVGGVHDGVGLFAGDVAGTEDHENAVPHRYAQNLRAGMHGGYLLLSASTPGNFLPSRNSSDAPPPVEMCVILSATPAALTAATVSPPPTMETAAPLSATA